MLNGLKSLCKNYSNLIINARGLGTFCSFDGTSPQIRDKIVINLKNKGIQCGPSGDVGFRFRPALIFNKTHADILLKRLDSVLKSL